GSSQVCPMPFLAFWFALAMIVGGTALVTIGAGALAARDAASRAVATFGLLAIFLDAADVALTGAAFRPAFLTGFFGASVSVTANAAPAAMDTARMRMRNRENTGWTPFMDTLIAEDKRAE